VPASRNPQSFAVTAYRETPNGKNSNAEGLATGISVLYVEIR
jgi:hypothetical protein